MEDELLTVEEVAGILKATRQHVYNLMNTRRLPYIQTGIKRGRRIRRSALNAYLASGERGLATEGESGYTKGQRRSPRLATVST